MWTQLNPQYASQEHSRTSKALGRRDHEQMLLDPPPPPREYKPRTGTGLFGFRSPSKLLLLLLFIPARGARFVPLLQDQSHSCPHGQRWASQPLPGGDTGVEGVLCPGLTFQCVKTTVQGPLWKFTFLFHLPWVLGDHQQRADWKAALFSLLTNPHKDGI